MKRQEAFDKMRKNRDTARRLLIIKRTEDLLAQAAVDQKRWDESRARHDAFDARIGVLTSCIPFLPHDVVQDELTRLGNEYGMNVGKPRGKLTVVGGGQ